MLYIPLDFENKWIETSIPFQGSPDFKYEKKSKEMFIETDDDVGGYALILKPDERSKGSKTSVSWKWKVTQFPTAIPSPPLKKENDDYALRIGVLIDNGQKELKLPSAVKKKLQKHQARVSHYIFYAALPASSLKEKRCATSAYSEQGLICHLPVTDKWSEARFFPLEDLEQWIKKPSKGAKIIGFWVFADTDNSESKSKAWLKDLKLESQSK